MRFWTGIIAMRVRLLILTVETEKLTSRLVNEPSTNNEIYPHIYGPINRDAIVRAETRAVESVPVQT